MAETKTDLLIGKKHRNEILALWDRCGDSADVLDATGGGFDPPPDVDWVVRACNVVGDAIYEVLGRVRK